MARLIVTDNCLYCAVAVDAVNCDVLYARWFMITVLMKVRKREILQMMIKIVTNMDQVRAIFFVAPLRI